jgi:predicted small secreted protein
MKKLFLFALVAGTFAACNEPKTETTETTIDTTTTPTETIVTETTTTTTTYTAAEGDVKKSEGKVMVYRNGSWVEAKEDVVLDNGIVVTKKGDVKNAEGKVIVIEEGQTVSKTGRFFDKAGMAVENAWDKTKEGVEKAANATAEGVKDAGKAVGNAAEKVADKTKDALDGKKKEEKK